MWPIVPRPPWALKAIAVAVLSLSAGAAMTTALAASGVGITGHSTATSGGPLPSKTGMETKIDQAHTQTTTKISSEIERVGQALAGRISELTATTTKAAEVQDDFARDRAVREDAVEGQRRIQDTYGPRAGGILECGTIAGGAGKNAGRMVEDEQRAQGNDEVLLYNFEFDSSTATRDYHKTRAPITYDARVLMPNTGTRGARGEDHEVTAEQAREYITHVTNPRPTPNLDDEQAKTPAGDNYAVERRLKQAKLSMPQRTLQRVQSAYEPTMPMEGWAQSRWESLGRSGDPDSVTEDGLMSPMAMLRLQVDSYYSNPNFFDGLLRQNRTAIARESLRMRAAQMEMQYRSLEYLESIAALLSQQAASDANDEHNERLENLRQQALNVQTN